MRKRLTDKVVAALPVPAKGNHLTWDAEQRGFAARVTAGNDRSFVVSYYMHGRERRMTIGSFPAWTTTAAREAAGDFRRMARGGVDPLVEREAARAPAEDALFEGRAETFLKVGRKKRGLPMRPATKKEYKRALLRYAAALHGRPLVEISRGEIADVIQRVALERGDVTAARCRAALSRLYSWAIANGHAEVNPVTGTQGYSTPKRQRVLTDAELRAIWAATAELTSFNLIVRLCLWTGARRSEPGDMADSELDDGVWTVPGSRTKNGRPLVLPLPRQAITALAAWPRVKERDLLFGRGGKGFQGWSQAKRRLDQASGVANWDLHDARRTVETRLARLGVLKEIVNRTLNHAVGPITATYDLHSYLPEKAVALQRWADELDRITGQPTGEVVPLRQRR